MTVQEIQARARECVGTPVVHQGRKPGQALDCVGLVLYATSSRCAAAIGYPACPVFDAWWEYARQLLVSANDGGPILVFALGGALHMGVDLGDEGFVHPDPRRRVLVIQPWDERWRRRLIGRFRGVRRG